MPRPDPTIPSLAQLPPMMIASTSHAHVPTHVERDRSRSRSRTRAPESREWSHITLDQKYAYRSLDKVQGEVEHATLPEADRVKIHLVGTCYITENRFVNGAYRDIEREWEFLRLTKKYELDATLSSSNEGTSSGACTPVAGVTRPVLTKFWFRLPETLLETVCPLQMPYHLLLPPTLGTDRDDGLDDMSPRHPTPAEIEYTIQAELLRGRELLKRYTQPFRVAPRHFTVPGTFNPPPDYDSSVTVEQDVTRTVGGKIGSFRIVLPRPPALLSSLEEHQMTTRVPFTLEFHSTTSKPPKISAIGLKLIAITSVRSEHILEGGQDDSKRAIECRLNRWEYAKDRQPTWLAARPGVYTTELEVPVTICGKGYVAVPEFESCLVDRTYRVVMKFELTGSSGGGIPINACRIRIPVWIFADEYYGIPSEQQDGKPIKMRRRYAPPDDYYDSMNGQDAEPGSLPKYEDSLLAAINDRIDQVSLSAARRPTAPPARDGSVDNVEAARRLQLAAARHRDPPTIQAPFRFHGQEPDYWESQSHRTAVGGQCAPVRHSSYSGFSLGSALGAGTEGRARTRETSAATPPSRVSSVPAEIEGIEPVNSPSDDPDREPAWQVKEREEQRRQRQIGLQEQVDRARARRRATESETPQASRPVSPEARVRPFATAEQ
ncbi:hypothetical protein PYCC9005_003021 [Savitreella phatthalungensis]